MKSLEASFAPSPAYLAHQLSVKKRAGHTEQLDVHKIRSCLVRASRGHEKYIAIEEIVREAIRNIYDGVTTSDLERALILATVPYIEKDPAYSTVSAQLLLQKIYKEVIGQSVTEENLDELYQKTFIATIRNGVTWNIFDERLLGFDLETLAKGLVGDRDNIFGYLGLQMLYDRYFRIHEESRIELPQAFWMRIAMGLALNEENRTARTLEFYEMLSTLRYVSSTPTLFHAGLTHPQLSSCFLGTVEDDLHHIFKCISDIAQLAKWSGGLGYDWTNIRGTGAFINTTKVSSQGVIPFLKVASDVTAAINRSGNKRGANTAYLECWHFDFEEFLDLRRNTGDDRRRTHDMNTASWVPDLFMKRVMQDKPWTFFSPDDVPELHDLYGMAFEEKYEEYERKAHNGEITIFKVVQAKDLWRKMLTRLFETGHPWITFKDACNIRSPQDHVGVVHSSNLCTEITLNTSKTETAVCNLGSINLAQHIKNGAIDKEMLATTVHKAIRMLDNVIDVNFYPTKEAENSNKRHRPIGLGLMGLQDAFFKVGINFDAPEALPFVDELMEFISYHAIFASSMLAKEKGTYETFKGSKWDRGILPLDTLALLEQERGVPIEVNRTMSMDWTPVREHIKQYGMRNSNTMAIAPTATISNIAGCFPCIEPMYKNIYVKANMFGEFTIVNKYLVDDLKKHNLWNDEILAKLKYYDGSVQQIDEIPQEIKDRHKEAFEIDPEWMIKLTAARGKWIDQSQSHNIFMRGASGKQLNAVYLLAWKSGLKTTYYYRTLSATQIEKSTLDAAKFGFTQKRTYAKLETAEAPAEDVALAATPVAGARSCGILEPDCESCQ